jgi:hypothetical protein
MVEGILAVVKDLFFVARIRETGRLVGAPVEVCRSVEELRDRLGRGRPPGVALVDLTAGWDYDELLALLEAANPRPAITAFTTHALARTTQRWHSRCDRVVTKETLTRELPDLLAGGAAAAARPGGRARAAQEERSP